MVHEHPETRLDRFDVQYNTILREGNEIARFPTPICELARFAGRLFIILHPYPIREHLEYGGTNLWCIDVTGKSIWKAQNLNTKVNPTNVPSFGSSPNNYRGIELFDMNNPKILVGTMDDYYTPVVNMETGRHMSGKDVGIADTKIRDHIFAQSRLYLYALPCDPPSASKLQDFSLR